ncbi:hypothetical protein CEXT_794381 [Caerostris extrusa]|uniref:Secreted protein n=1 Tax=Caerostris extrusa TaxID=172846 RepID=A0AAV4Y247_CAEEX|nr:hypothetical protein CEXT_794381 [Caerostris extrusa]
MTGMTLIFLSTVGTLTHITSKISLSIASSFHRSVSTEPRILPQAVVAKEECYPFTTKESRSRPQVAFNILSNIEQEGGEFVLFFFSRCSILFFNVGRKKS